MIRGLKNAPHSRMKSALSVKELPAHLPKVEIVNHVYEIVIVFFILREKWEAK